MPISDRLIQSALGMDITPAKRLIIMSVYQLEPPNYRPNEAKEAPARRELAPFVPSAWPAMFGPLAAYMNRAVFVDGCRNYVGTTQHRAGTSALSCLNPTNGKPESLGPAGGITIDQHIAKSLSANSPHRSVLWGLSEDGLRAKRRTASGIFASGKEQNISHFEHAQEMMDRLFPEPSGNARPSEGSSFKPLRDRLVGDINKLKGRLAPEERQTLEGYEELILDFDKRQEALAALTCDAPPGAPMNQNGQDHLESMMAQSALALRCGLTQVIGVTIGTANNHNEHIPKYREVALRSSDPEIQMSGKANYYGHAGDNQALYLEAKRNMHELHFKELVKVMDLLTAAKEQDGSSVMDHTAVLYVTGNAQSNSGHHAPMFREAIWPALLIAGDKTGFKTGGRFMTFNHNPQQPAEHRNLVDLYRTLAIGVGVEPGDFGKDATASQGKITELLKA